jgi:hypothetical protein
MYAHEHFKNVRLRNLILSLRFVIELFIQKLPLGVPEYIRGILSSMNEGEDASSEYEPSEDLSFSDESEPSEIDQPTFSRYVCTCSSTDPMITNVDAFTEYCVIFFCSRYALHGGIRRIVSPGTRHHDGIREFILLLLLLHHCVHLSSDTVLAYGKILFLNRC